MGARWLKLLPESLAHDPERLARLRREARALAALNHPGIATVHEIGEAEGTSFLVMELVEGPTLAERLKGGALPVDETLELGRQMAAALEAAHDKAIIHRDLKPANIKLTKEGQVKLLDFGLAKVSAGGAVDSEGPTATPEGTAEGTILGTAAYMSPEQARGQELDRRTDVWSFGCVLYEMLTGRRAFRAGTVSDTLAAVLKHEPEWDALPKTTPVLVRSLLRRCLQKDQARRLHDIADARIELEEALAEPVGPPSAAVSLPARRTVRRRLAYWAIVALVIVAGIASFIVWLTLSPPSTVLREPQRLSIVPPRDAPVIGVVASGNSGVLALSPDGTRLVYVAAVAGKTQLYLRPMDQLEARPIPGTVGARTPFFSPDGESVGFWREGRLMTISLRGGMAGVIAEGNDRGATWGPDGTILFVEKDQAGLRRVSEDGGAPQAVTDGRHRWPQILPGGKATLFTIQSQSGRHEECRIAVLSLETGEWRVLLEGGTLARYLPSGYVVYTRYGSLLAVPFDLERLEVTGEPTLVLRDVAMYGMGYAYLAVSAAGSLAYVTGGYGTPERSLVWIDRQGKTLPVTEERRPYSILRISPDGTRLAVSISRARRGQYGMDVWVHDLRQGVWTRLTFEDSNDEPVWSPDGRWVAFSSNREDNWYLFKIPAGGSAALERLGNSPPWAYATDWSPDGRFLLIDDQSRGGGTWDLSVLPVEEGPEARRYLATAFNEHWAQLSPDGDWVAYCSDESGRIEVYVQPFLEPGRRWTVSPSEGSSCTDDAPGMRWSRDGRELFFRGLDERQMMVAAVQTEPTFHAEPPRPLFTSELPIGSWDVMPDGQRFVAVLKDEKKPPEQIVVIPNFASELEQKVRAAQR
ncbi:MAG: protein kinase [Acidobacteriota bacterium]